MENKKRFNTFTDSDSAVNNYFNRVERTENSSAKSAQAVSAEMELIMKKKRSTILTIATKQV